MGEYIQSLEINQNLTVAFPCTDELRNVSKALEELAVSA